jgi:hypothetical protein
MREFDVGEALSSLNREGLFVVNDALDAQEVEAMAAEGRRLLAERPPFVTVPIQSPSLGFRLNLIPGRLDRHDGWNWVPSYGRVLGAPAVRAVSKGYLGRTWGVSNFIYDFSVAADAGELFSLHYDDFDGCRCLKVYVYITDCDAGNGAFRYVPRTHRLAHWLIRRDRGKLNVPSQPGSSHYTEYNLKTLMTALAAAELPAALQEDYQHLRSRLDSLQDCVVAGRAGTLVFFDTAGIHGGGHHTGGDRYICRYHLVDRRYVLRHVPEQASPPTRFAWHLLWSVKRRLLRLSTIQP